MDHADYRAAAPFASNPPANSERQPYNQGPLPAFGSAIPTMATQYQPSYAPYAAVPNQGPILQPLQHTTYNIPVQPIHVPDYLVYSVLTTLFCCLPLGTVALVFSILTRDANQKGNSIEAQQNSRMARNFAHCALGVGIVLIITITVLKFQLY